MKVIDFNQSNSVLNRFVAELRDVNIQGDRLRFRRNVERIGEVMALSDTAYYAYRRELQNRPPAEGNRREPEGGRTFLLAMGEDGEDGVVVDLTGGRYEGLPAFVPDARKQLDAHIASIAEYCVREGVENTENGEWSITYEELYFQFDGTTLTSRNGMGRLLQEKLRQREEDTYSGIKKLGADPFELCFSGEYLSSRLGKRKKVIKQCLLDIITTGRLLRRPNPSLNIPSRHLSGTMITQTVGNISKKKSLKL